MEIILRAEPQVYEEDRNPGRMQGLDVLGGDSGRPGDFPIRFAAPPCRAQRVN